MELTLELLNDFLNNIITYHDVKELQKDDLQFYRIQQAIEKTPEAKNIWHFEVRESNQTFLWRKKAWLESVERLELARRNRQKEIEVTELRRNIFINACNGVMESIGIPKESWEEHRYSKPIVKMVNIMLKKKSPILAELFGIENIENIPELPNKYTVLDELGKVLYEL
jgi:hypothetical protein